MNIFAEGVYRAISPFIHVDYISANGGNSPTGDNTVVLVLTAVVTIAAVASAVIFLWWRKKKDGENPEPPDEGRYDEDEELGYDEPYGEQY